MINLIDCTIFQYALHTLLHMVNHITSTILHKIIQIVACFLFQLDISLIITSLSLCFSNPKTYPRNVSQGLHGQIKLVVVCNTAQSAMLNTSCGGINSPMRWLEVLSNLIAQFYISVNMAFSVHDNVVLSHMIQIRII